MNSPSPFTPLGAKGLAEGNCMSTPACIANAIADALSVRDVILPATPRRIHALMAEQKQDMKPRPFDYVRPDTVEEVLALLAEYGEDARILAGGQSLVPMLNLRLIDPAVLIDISRLAELDAIRDRGDQIEIGAAVTQNTLMAWPQLAQKLPLLAAALPFVGHFQTRNKGTVCGSVAHADPSSEIPLALAVPAATVVLRSQRGERVVAAEAFQQDMLTTARAPDELIAAVRFPVIEGKGAAFRRSGAPPRRLRHHRARGHGRRARRGAARRRRHGRAADGPFNRRRRRGARLPLGRTSSKATRTCTPRRRCGAISSAISAPLVVAEAIRCAA